MGRNLPILFVRQFLVLLLRGVGFTALMMFVTLFAVFRGIWEQSHFVAVAWMTQLAFAGIDSRFDGSMYWLIRTVALLMMIVALVALAQVTVWLVSLALRL